MKATSIVVDPMLAALIGTCPSNAGELRNVIKARINETIKADIEKRVYLRKYTGIGDIRGMLDHVDDGTPVVSINNAQIHDVKDCIVITPMNDDTIYPAFRRLIKNGGTVFPIVHSSVSSKHLRGSMFPGNVPFSIYIPPEDLTCFNCEAMKSRFSARGIETVMVKDDFGYHSGHVIPYIITPVSMMDEVLPGFARQCYRLYEPSGIVVDEFIGGIESTVIKVHVFGSVIPGEVMQYRVKLRGLDGVFKSDDESPDLLESVSISTGAISDNTKEMINYAASRYFPAAMASVDMVIGMDGNPVIIDVNGRAGSFGEIQEQLNINDHNPFDFINEVAMGTSLLQNMKRAVDPGLDT